ncbi:hypothetical protein SAMN05444161_4231 [Rhizobiales bacterium GAS191]|jgi:hypothetical protein|nr:hypothetical protein SAMN05519103_03524 [Rhizobiales bacterium GAS113]SED86529.1 hypothetical protein SAMN05444161_4231 [Rhizobiales bacterium GAS191]
MIGTHDPPSQKSAHSLSIQEQVRKLLIGVAECSESTKKAIASSERCQPKQALNLDSEPMGRRMRESF